MERTNRMVGASAIGAAMLIGSCTPSAQAGYVVDFTQQGSNVVASGSGSIDLTGLTFYGEYVNVAAGLVPSVAFENTGTSADIDAYAGITGPMSFGSGTGTNASSTTGASAQIVGSSMIYGLPLLFVPHDYASDTPLSDTATYDSQTFSSLGVTPGTYEWTWGSGANQNFTIEIGNVVPEPSTWAMMLIGFAGLDYAGYRRAKRNSPVLILGEAAHQNEVMSPAVTE